MPRMMHLNRYFNIYLKPENDSDFTLKMTFICNILL